MKIGEEATKAARLRSLTVRGMCPLKPVMREALPQSPRGVNQRAQADAPVGRKGPPRPTGPEQSAAREHAVAAGEVPDNRTHC